MAKVVPSYDISVPTWNKLKVLIGQGPPVKPGKYTGGGTSRYSPYVRITGDIDGDLYPCVPCYFDPLAEAWVEFDEHWAKSVNDVVLRVDWRYRAQVCGEIDGVLVFEAAESVPVKCPIQYETEGEDKGKLSFNYDIFGDGLLVSDDDCPIVSVAASTPGCHLDLDDDGKLFVTVDTLTGCGLKVQPGETEEDCDKLAVDPSALAGCHIAVQVEEGECDKFKVDLDSLADCGLMVVTHEPISGIAVCDTLAVDVASLAGCHLHRIETEDECDKLGVTPSTLITSTSGLEVVAGGCDTLRVKKACHIDVTADGVSVTVDTLIGETPQGLVVSTPGEGCPYIGVATGCHVTIDSDGAVAVTPSTLAGCNLLVQPGETEDDCTSLAVDVPSLVGCNLKVVETEDECDKLAVDVDSLAGDGLYVTDDDCPKLKLKAPTYGTYGESCAMAFPDTWFLGGGSTGIMTEAGTYRFVSNMNCQMSIDASSTIGAGGVIQCRYYNATTSTVVSATFAIAACGWDGTHTGFIDGTGWNAIFDVAAGDEILTQFYAQSSIGMVWGSFGGSGGNTTWHRISI